jgi:hypothetical protein
MDSRNIYPGPVLDKVLFWTINKTHADTVLRERPPAHLVAWQPHVWRMMTTPALLNTLGEGCRSVSEHTHASPMRYRLGLVNQLLLTLVHDPWHHVDQVMKRLSRR